MVEINFLITMVKIKSIKSNEASSRLQEGINDLISLAEKLQTELDLKCEVMHLQKKRAK